MMEEFLTEHGGIIVSGIVSIITVVLILIVMIAVSNMDLFTLNSIMGL